MSLIGGWRKYEWPNQVWAVDDQIRGRLANAWWTFYAHCQLRAHGVRQVGAGLSVSGYLHVLCRRKDSIRLGKRVALVSRFRSNLVGLTNPMVLDTRFGGRIVIGDHSGLSGVVLSSRSAITIGKHVKIGGNVRIFDHDFHALSWEDRRQGPRDRVQAKTAPVVIGDDVFIGTNAMILKGTEIGDRCVVAAGSVLAGKKIPPDSLVAGNPAKIIRQFPTK